MRTTLHAEPESWNRGTAQEGAGSQSFLFTLCLPIGIKKIEISLATSCSMCNLVKKRTILHFYIRVTGPGGEGQGKRNGSLSRFQKHGSS